MELVKMMTKLKQKTFQPSVYSVILFSTNGAIFNCLSVDFRQEDAIENAKKLAKQKGIMPNAIKNISIHANTLEQIITMATEISFDEEIKKLPPCTESAKSLLMKKIIDSKDVKMLNLYMNSFSEQEIQYLTTAMKSQKDI